MLAALFTLLTAHTSAIGHDACENEFDEALQGLESAAEQAEDTALASSVELLRVMYLQNGSTSAFQD